VKKPSVVIFVSGGNVQEILANTPDVDIEVIDSDVDNEVDEKKNIKREKAARKTHKHEVSF